MRSEEPDPFGHGNEQYKGPSTVPDGLGKDPKLEVATQIFLALLGIGNAGFHRKKEATRDV